MATNQINESEQSVIKCERINLLSSTLKQTEIESKKTTAKFSFSIDADVFVDYIVARLTIKLKNQITSQSHRTILQSLDFCLVGYFSTQPTTPHEVLENFTKLNTLSIIWPYAREYISDTLRRTGVPFPVLPIINPQVLAEEMERSKMMNITNYDHPFSLHS